MATWITPIDSETDPDAPLTSSLAKRWDNNVIAMTEGASGAPKVQDGALGSTVTTAGNVWVNSRLGPAFSGASGYYKLEDAALSTTATTAGATWVGNRIGLQTAGAVGTYAMLSIQTAPSTAIVYSSGVGALGTNLKYASASGTFLGGNPPGNWKSVGYAVAGPTGTYPLNDDRRVTMWFRFE